MPWSNTPEKRQRDAETYNAEYRQNRQIALGRAGGSCDKCGRRGRLQTDHIIPVSQGGGHELANLQALCCGPGSCHAAKTAAEGGRRPRDPEPTPRTAW